jgi:periplasmic protein TonB
MRVFCIVRTTAAVAVVFAAALLNAQDSTQGSKSEPSPPPQQDEQKPPKVSRPQRVRISQGVGEKFIVKKVPPQYPAEAREQHIQGTVLLKAEIDKDGNVESLSLISGHPLLAPAAIDAVRQWKYKPFLLKQSTDSG